jgi:adenylate kinase
MKKHLILLGAPGSGKGTQSTKLLQLGYKHVSTGNLLRDEIAKGSELGNKVKAVMDAGQLVSDDLVVELLKSNLLLDKNVYIFDGYPRNAKQAETLDGILTGHEYLAVYFEIDTDMLVERISNRRMTKDGKYIYNLKTNPPKVSGICDVTGEALIHRADDMESVVRERMNVFSATIYPVLDFFEAKDRLLTINADQSLESVYNEIIKKLNL